MQRILFRILDLVKKQNVTNRFLFYRKTAKWSIDDVKKYQNARLLEIMRFALKTVPFYIDFAKENGFSVKDFETIESLSKLPIIDRDILQKYGDKLLANGVQKDQLVKGSSSGTTGIPISYYMDKKALSAGTAAGYALWSMTGWKLGQKSVHIWGNESSIKRWNTPSSRLKNKLIKQLNIASTELNQPMKLEGIAQKIIKFKPKTIDGYASSINTLSKYFEQKGYSLPSLKAVISTAENLDEAFKFNIEKNLALTADLYGSGEVLGIAIRPAGDNKFYVLDTHVYLETIKSGIEGMKEILVTDLDNYAMPLIRYKIGDMIDDVNPSSIKNKYPFQWFGSVQGRSSDIITTPNGKKLHPVNIFGGTTFRKFPQITRHKVIWDGIKLKFVFESKESFDHDALYREIAKLLEGFDVLFEVTHTDKIYPSKSGKYKYVEFQ
jgi:phenylacetate-CoA ligase